MARVALALLLAASGCGTRAPAPPDASRSEEQKNARVECQADNGIEFHGRRRYVHGANYAWHEFATDFGGLAAWNRGGVSGDEAAIDRELAELAASGASVVRWWLFPELRSDGLLRDSSGGVPRLGARALADVDRALALAERHDLYLMLTLFSFDAFRAVDRATPMRIPFAPIARSRVQVERLLDRLVRPLVAHVARGPHAHRVFAWDLFNEPEWAVYDIERNMCDLASEERLECVSQAEMQWLLGRLAETTAACVQGLPQHARPLLTIGSVDRHAQGLWASVPQDFYQFHFYQHEYAAEPLQPPRYDKPAIIGEFPSWGVAETGGRPRRNALELEHDIEATGFRGALGWTFNRQSTKSDWPALSAALRSFADQHGCRARY